MWIASEKEPLTRLRHAVQQAGSISEWSRQNGIDRSTVSLVVNGNRAPSLPFFHALQLRGEVVYVAKRGDIP
jgi:hypothetical protein